jgi:glutathione synthase/RimK-type ligase-like ATP-grasp enzyme
MKSSFIHKTVKKIAEFQVRNNYKKHWEDDINKYLSCTDKKSALTRFSEKRALQKYWGCVPFQYYRFGFYRKDCKLTVEEMKKYVPNFFAYFLFFPRIFTGYVQICRDKSLTHTYLSGLNIAQPVMLLKYHLKGFCTNENLPVADDSALEILSNCGAKKIFIKPNFGLGGKGIFVFSKTDSGYKTKDGKKLDKSFIKENLLTHSFVIQEGLKQHTDMDAIYSGSINTCRIITRVIDGKAEILFSMLRMGQKGSEVDNASQGGLYCKIDKESGQLGDFAYSNDRQKYFNHTDTNVEFAKTKVKQWDEINRFILKVATQCREIGMVGWDVALTETGPVIIEINEGPDIEIVQDLYGGIKDMMGIDNPGKWWNHDKFTTLYEN